MTPQLDFVSFQHSSRRIRRAMESGRALVDRMAVSLQASLMKQYGSVESAEVFCASRCGEAMLRVS